MASTQPAGLWRATLSGKDDPVAAADPQQLMAGPILSETAWGGRLARPRAHVAVVVVYKRGDHLVVWPHERKRVLLHRHPATMYEIDLGLHSTAVSAELPSRGHEGSFTATISVQWRVLDPSAVVRHRVSDITEALSPALLRRARRITRQFGLNEALDAENELNEQLRGVDLDVTAIAAIEEGMRKAIKGRCLGAEYGLWTRVITHLELDKAAIEHNAKMKHLEWAIQEEEAAQKLRLLQNRNQQAITAERMDIYRSIIASDDVERFALRLSQHPDEISAITAIIREDQLTSRRDTVDFISRMVESGVVERWEVSDQVREALAWVSDATARILTDSKQPDVDADHLPRQRRRGRGQPIEQRLADEPPLEGIAVEAEALPVEDHRQSEPPAETDPSDVPPATE